MPSLVSPLIEPGSMAAGGQPTLEAGTDLRLRPFEADDAAWVIDAFADPDIQRWHHLRIDTLDEAERWIDGWSAAWANETDGSWLIARRSSGERLGRLGLRGVDLAGGCAELSYWVVPAARGTGTATAAVRSGSRWLFDSLGLHRVEIMHSVDNAVSCRVARKAGFAPEGTLRGALLHADGWHDMHLHARLSTDP